LLILARLEKGISLPAYTVETNPSYVSPNQIYAAVLSTLLTRPDEVQALAKVEQESTPRHSPARNRFLLVIFVQRPENTSTRL
jgi:hypothetical protein